MTIQPPTARHPPLVWLISVPVRPWWLTGYYIIPAAPPWEASRTEQAEVDYWYSVLRGARET